MDVLNLRALLTLDKTDYDRGLNEADSTANSFGSKFGGKMKTAAKVGAAALGAFAVSSVKTGADFDKSMSQVAATMGYTVEDLNTAGSEAQQTYEKLEQAARKAGSETAFSAEEASQALNYMALAGYDAETSMAMMPKVLNLAAAGNMDLANASDMVTDTQSALGLSLDETSQLIDKMAKASSKSNTSVEQLGSAMLTVGGTAKMLKGGTTELSAALGILADNGTKGAEGGTALRNVLSTISGAKFEKSFGALGVSAYDSEGKLRSLKDILADMNVAMEGMTEQEKTQLINKTFNARDLKNVNALLATSTDRWDELTGAIDDSENAAANMAETQLDNLSGDVTILKSAFSELQITISDMDNGVLRDFVQGITEGIGVLTDALKADSLTEALSILGNGIESFASSAVERFSNMASSVGQAIPNLISTFMNGFASLSGNLRSKASDFIDVGLNLIKNIAKGIIDNIPTFIETVPTIIENFAGIINDNAPKIIATGVSILKALASGIIKAIPVLISNIPKIIKAAVAAFKAFNWANVGRLALRGIANGLKAAGGLLKSAVTKPINAAKSFMIAGFAAAKEKIVSTFSGIKDAVKSKLDAAKDAVKGIVDKIKGFFPLHIGRIFSGLSLPHFSVSGGKAPFGIGGKGSLPSFSVSWYKKAMENPYMFTDATLFGAGEAGDEIMYGKKNLMNDITEAVGTKPTTITINNYIDGTKDPEVYAKKMSRQLKLELRTI